MHYNNVDYLLFVESHAISEPSWDGDITYLYKSNNEKVDAFLLPSPLSEMVFFFKVMTGDKLIRSNNYCTLYLFLSSSCIRIIV